MIRNCLFILCLFFTFGATAKVEVLFHPHDPTLETIAHWISSAEHSVDIAMYNMDTTERSPIITTLQSPTIQQRLANGKLQVRVLLELYGKPADNEKKRQALENLNVDVRFVGLSIKAHHKFAVIDAEGPLDRVVTGSANWSSLSAKNYNENILFFTQEPEATFRYQLEFNRLWNISKEFGKTWNHRDIQAPFADSPDLEILFNTPRVLKEYRDEPYELTREVTELIAQAQNKIDIASTRIRLIPILEALQQAGNRGVKIRALINQDDYRDLKKRAAYLLDQPHLELRVKFFNLRVSDFIHYQMHNKFMLVDGKTALTGSFNWSTSSEKSHFENIAILKGALFHQIMPQFETEFESLWNMGRSEFSQTYEALKANTYQGCELPQMALSDKEIRSLLRFSKNCKSPTETP